MRSRLYALMFLLASAFFASAYLSPPAMAVEPGELLSDPKLEARARNLSAELRCLVCQNQSIDDSDAPLAKDLRLLVRERLKAGDTDSEVMDFVVARYGEFVLLRPRFGLHTALLWGTPIIGLLLASLAIFMAYRARHKAQTRVEALSDDEEARLKKILEQDHV